jgi:peptidoglycan/LPS O-acetylase OafA/YrhL
VNESGRDALDMPNQLVPQRPQLAALTAARFFAAFQVLLFHLWGMDGLTWTPKWLQTFASAGYTGVTFFFVLSGFIFVYTYAGKPINLREFWRARLARLYPVYLLALLLTAPLFFSPDIVKMAPEEAWPVQHMGLTVALVLTIMQAWIPQAALGWNVVSWSVSVEIFFYSMFPWLIARLRNISNRGLVLVGGASWAVSVSLAVIYVVLKPDGPLLQTGFSFWRLMVVCNPLLRLPEFLFGLACGIWFVREQHTAKWATLLTLLGVGGVLGPIAASSAIPHPILATGLMAPAYAAVICGLALRPRWIAALERPLLVLLGEASYALYLLHGLVLIVAMFIIQPNPNGPVSPVRALMATCAAVLVSVLVFRFVDAPLRRRLRGQRPTKAALAGA